MIGRTGISPAPTVNKTARVACGAWAWIVRWYGGEYHGHTHAMGYVPFSRKEYDAARAGDPDSPRGKQGRVVIDPWNRLEKFTEWASALPNASGMPGGSRVDSWLWALLTVAAWLDSFIDANQYSGKATSTVPIVASLKWDTINDEEFERLVFNIVLGASGYSNLQWLTNTHAPDRGRDISANKTVEDALSGSRVLRVVLQCKHWRNQGIGMDEVSKLVNQMSHWEPPKVDELVIATTGRFTSDAVDWIEKHNYERKVPAIMMWPNSHLESLLATRPQLVAQFRLR